MLTGTRPWCGKCRRQMCWLPPGTRASVANSTTVTSLWLRVLTPRKYSCTDCPPASLGGFVLQVSAMDMFLVSASSARSMCRTKWPMKPICSSLGTGRNRSNTQWILGARWPGQERTVSIATPYLEPHTSSYAVGFCPSHVPTYSSSLAMSLVYIEGASNRLQNCEWPSWREIRADIERSTHGKDGTTPSSGMASCESQMPKQPLAMTGLRLLPVATSVQRST